MLLLALLHSIPVRQKITSVLRSHLEIDIFLTTAAKAAAKATTANSKSAAAAAAAETTTKKKQRRPFLDPTDGV